MLRVLHAVLECFGVGRQRFAELARPGEELRAVEELDAVFTQISLDLSQQYLLSYYPQEERKDKYFRFISLSVKSRPTAALGSRMPR